MGCTALRWNFFVEGFVRTIESNGIALQRGYIRQGASNSTGIVKFTYIGIAIRCSGRRVCVPH